MASVPYTPLNPEEQEIRLLILWPGSLDKQPRCDIEVGSLKDGYFAALSYVWGDGKDRKDIIVGDQIISVTANLELALRYLQCKDLLLRIWVDALCINQSDAVEKALQVGFMSQIYSKAHTTYMWMGAPVYYSDVAIDLIRGVLSIPKLSWTNRQVFAVRQLIERPYWTRVWVVQESFYSRHAIVKCGHDEVDFDMFYDVVEFMDFHNQRPPTDRCPESTDDNIIHFAKPFPFKPLFKLCQRDRGDEPIRLDIFRWLNYTGNFSSTLARDRIFAFLNLSFLTDTRFIKPDYSSKPDRRIFSEITGYIMRSRVTSHDCLLPLQLRQVGKLLNLPSWVPDWTIATHHASFVPPPYGTPTYCAGQGKFWIDYEPLGVDVLGRSVQFRFSDDFETLIIRGVVVDSVICAVPVADGDELARQPNFRRKSKWVIRRQVLDACRKWQATALTFHAYGARLSEAIWRTIVANECPTGTYPAHEDCGTLFEQWKDAVEREDKKLLDTKLHEFDARVTTMCELRAFCLTEKGFSLSIETGTNLATNAVDNGFRYENSLGTNPHIFAGVFWVAISHAERVFVYEGLANGTASLAKYDIVAPVFPKETFPDDWYRRGVPLVLPVDSEQAAEMGLANSRALGTNQGLGKFVPLDLSTDLSIASPTQIGCFILENLLDVASGQLAPTIYDNFELYTGFIKGVIAPFFINDGYFDCPAALSFTEPSDSAGSASGSVNSSGSRVNGAYPGIGVIAPNSEPS